jgi:inner membrane protein
MDSITQIALGASVAGIVGTKSFGRKALVTGAILGTLPDLDVLLNYQTAIQDFTFHRGFSHSLLVLSALSIVIYYLVLLLKPTLSSHKKALFLVIFLPLITHPLLDALTTYGTQLLWPINIPPISWSSIFIIDPLYTLPLLFGVIGLWVKRGSVRWQKINAVMLGVSCLYLIQGQAQRVQIHTQLQHDPIAQTGEIFISPTPFNTLLWRVLSYQEDRYYVSFTHSFNQQPLSWQPFDTGRELLNGFNSTELERLEWFSSGFLQFTKQEGQLIATDLRVGLTLYYPFAFSLAKDENQWQPVLSEKMAAPKINWTKLLELLHL